MYMDTACCLYVKAFRHMKVYYSTVVYYKLCTRVWSSRAVDACSRLGRVQNLLFNDNFWSVVLSYLGGCGHMRLRE